MSCVYICPASFASDSDCLHRKENLMLTPSHKRDGLILTNGSSSGQRHWGHLRVARETQQRCRGMQRQLCHGPRYALKTLALDGRMFPLLWMWEAQLQQPLIVARLGHPSRCLVAASCGSGAAKSPRKHFTRSARPPKPTQVRNLCLRVAPDMSDLEGYVRGGGRQDHSLLEHERTPKM